MTSSYIHQKRHQLRKLRGETAYVDVAEARVHIASLLGVGWSIRSIGAAAEVPASVVSRISRGRQLKAAPKTVRSIVAIPAQAHATRTNHAGEPFVSRVGTVRRIQALLYMGWRHQDIAEHAGLSASGCACLLSQQGRWVTLSSRDAIARVYRELSHRRGPSERTRTRARRLGYVGPAAWDDIDNDAAPEPEDLEGLPQAAHPQQQVGGQVDEDLTDDGGGRAEDQTGTGDGAAVPRGVSLHLQGLGPELPETVHGPSTGERPSLTGPVDRPVEVTHHPRTARRPR